MQFNIHEAKTQFSKLVAAVERGERVTICRNGRPVIECVPANSRAKFPYGAWGKPSTPQNDEYLVDPTEESLLDEMGL